MNPVRSVIVLGGGTAGWMSAAALGRFLPKVKVTLIESDDIGIVGVGEATVPPIRQFNAMLGIPEGNFLKATKATYKLGIQFNDWRRIGHSYFHPFGAYGPEQELDQFHQAWLALRAAGLIDSPDGVEGADRLDAYSICAMAGLQDKVTTPSQDPKSPYARLHSAYHFDASLYAGLMRENAEKSGVRRVEGEVVEVMRDSVTGFVTGLRLKSGQVLEADFFVDCSGFRALLSDGVPWIDWSHWLPMDRAWAMPCEVENHRVPYTVSSATEGGWIWRIPLQHRMGNGHVFSTRFMDEDVARQMLIDRLPGKPLADPRLIRFRTGRRERFWDGNVVAMGLASGFIEPLESTSIYFIQSAISKLISHWPDRTFGPANIMQYNRRMAEDYDHVRDVIILHYHLTERDDSPLWNHVRTMTVPDELQGRIDVFCERGMIINRTGEMFRETSWLAIMIGQGLMPQGYSALMDQQDLPKLAESFRRLRELIARDVAPLPTQDEFLRHHGLI